MRKFLAIASIFLAFVLVGAGCSQFGADQGSSSKTIKVGAILPLTGPQSPFGERLKGGFEIAEKEINKNGGVSGKKIKVVYEDSKNKGKTAVSAFKKLTEVNDVNYIFVFGTAPTKSTIPLAKNKNVTYFAHTAGKAAPEGENIFKDFYDYKRTGKRMAKIINDQSISRLGILSFQVPAVKQFFKGFNPILEENVDTKKVQYRLSRKKFNTSLTKLESFGSDGILVLGYPGKQAVNIAETIVNLNMDEKEIFSPYLYSLSEKLISDKTLNKLDPVDVIAFPKNVSQNEKWQKLSQKYKKKYGEKPNRSDTGFAYDDLKILAKAIDKVGNRPGQVNKTLKEITFEGSLGKLDFNREGKSARGSYPVKYVDGKWEPYNLESN